MKTILILYGFEHSGHHAAALALREAFLARDPALRVDLLNFFVFASRLLERVSTGVFYRIVKSTPALWDGIYTDPRSESRFTRFRGLVRALAPRGAEDAIGRYAPDAVVCTQAFPCGMMNDFKERHGSRIPLYAVLTDFSVPSYWAYDRVDAYFVACPEARAELLSEGVGCRRVFAAGIPVSPRFARGAARDEARRAFGFPPGAFTVIVMGGWSGWGALGRLAEEIERAAAGCAVAVVTGRNREIFDEMRARAAARGSRMRVMPYVQRMDLLMRAADLLVGKAGGMTAAEALTSGLPLVLVDSLPGQERANADYLYRGGAALMARSTGEAAALAAGLAAAPSRLRGMAERARALARPAASLGIADMVLKLAESRGEQVRVTR